MDLQQSIDLVNTVLYKPGWEFQAESHTNRFEGTINVTIQYPAFDSGSNSVPDAWRTGYSTEILPTARASFPIVTSDTDRNGVLRRLLSAILDIEQHEAREFLRDPMTGEAPFHPHRIAGMTTWGDMEHDLRFGLA